MLDNGMSLEDGLKTLDCKINIYEKHENGKCLLSFTGND